MKEEMAKTEKTETPDRDTATRAAYTAATRLLREENRDRFNELMRQETAARGIEWSPRPTEQQRAQQQLEALLAQYPGLKLPE